MQPTVSHERLLTLDLWRGFALFGVCIVNFVSANSAFLGAAQAGALPSVGFDWRMEALVNVFLGNKAHTIFSFMFGVGLAIIIERAERAGLASARFVIRRLVLLLAFGWVHFLLIYDGDILHRYALLGLVMYVMVRHLNLVWIVAVGSVFALLGRVMFEERQFILSLVGYIGEQGITSVPVNHVPPSTVMSNPADLTTFVSLNLSDAVDRSQEFSRNLWVNLYYLGRIMLGYAFWVSGMAHKLFALSVGVLWRYSLVLYLGWAALWAVSAALSESIAGTFEHLIYNSMRQANFLVLASAYLVTLSAVAKNELWKPVVNAVAMAGRMSLTTYVVQSFGMMLIFFSVGLGLGGTIGTFYTTIIAVLFYALQILISMTWLKWFRQGPLEWCWRKLVYA